VPPTTRLLLYPVHKDDAVLTIAIFLTPKRHFHAQNRVVLRIERQKSVQRSRL